MASPGDAPARPSVGHPIVSTLSGSTRNRGFGPPSIPGLARLAFKAFPIHRPGKPSFLKDMDFLHRPARDARQMNGHDITDFVVDRRGAAHSTLLHRRLQPRRIAAFTC